MIKEESASIAHGSIRQLEELLRQWKVYTGSKVGLRHWLKNRDAEIYIRRALRKMGLMLDIANITVHRRGEGYFTAFLAAAERLNPYDGIYIENVHEDRFAEYFRRNGWEETREPGGPLSFYKMKTKG